MKRNWVVINEYGDVYVRTNSEWMANNWLKAAQEDYPNQCWIVKEE